MLKVGWCDHCNVPILDGLNCGICGNLSRPLSFAKTELKPIFDEEASLYKAAISRTGVSNTLIPDGLFFYNVMGEVVIDGQKVFRLSFDRVRQEFIPKFFKNFSKSVPLFKGSSLDLTMAANEQILLGKENDAITFLEKEIQKASQLPVAVSFSGGKDSAVALALTKLVTDNFDAIFLNTSVEFEETVNYVHEIVDLWRVNLIEAHPPHDFFQLCDKFGPPSKKMKWCCKTQKFGPQNLLINDYYPDGVFVVSGVRKNESNIRSKFSKVQRNKMIPKQLLAFPLLDWTALDVWLYLLWKKIPHNKMYDYGFTRIGCWACPEKSPRDSKLLETCRPGLHRKLSKTLTEFAVRMKLENPELWVQSGNWKSRKTKWIKTTVCKAFQPCSLPGEIIYTFENEVHLGRVLEFMKVFGKLSQKGPMSKIDSKNIEVVLIGRKMRAKFKNSSIFPVFEKQLTRALNCVGCGACVGVCDSGSMTIESGEIKISNKCSGCLQCVTANGIRMSCVSVNYGSEVLAVA